LQTVLTIASLKRAKARVLRGERSTELSSKSYCIFTVPVLCCHCQGKVLCRYSIQISVFSSMSATGKNHELPNHCLYINSWLSNGCKNMITVMQGHSCSNGHQCDEISNTACLVHKKRAVQNFTRHTRIKQFMQLTTVAPSVLYFYIKHHRRLREHSRTAKPQSNDNYGRRLVATALATTDTASCRRSPSIIRFRPDWRAIKTLGHDLTKV